MCESIGSATGHIAAVTDRDSIIALYGIPKRELMDKPNSPELEKLMEQRKNYLYKNGDAPHSGGRRGGEIPPWRRRADFVSGRPYGLRAAASGGK